MTDTARLEKTRLALFNTTAPRYRRLIMPAFGPLAESLVRVADLQPHETAIDLGTGIGAVAYPAARLARRVVGLDYAAAMLPIARQNGTQETLEPVIFHQGDMHHLPYRAQAFDVALASFGFNGVDPERAFAEVERVLAPGGRLALQEWGEIDPASRIVKQVVKAHNVEQAEGFLADLRRLKSTPGPWDELVDEEDIARLLRRVGFQEVKVMIEQEAIPFEPLAFYRYKTAWAPYQAELVAMPEADRIAVESEVTRRLAEWTDAAGRFIWQPELVRIIARKP